MTVAADMVPIPKNTLYRDMFTCLSSRTFTDITFIVDGDEHPAHKAIVAGKSLIMTHFIRGRGVSLFDRPFQFFKGKVGAYVHEG